jgi:hypothetical protein
MFRLPFAAVRDTALLTSLLSTCQGGLSGPAPTPAGADVGEVRIAEVLFSPSDDALALPGVQWVELHNTDVRPRALVGASLVRADGATVGTLPTMRLPADSRLVVALGTGVDDLDLSDGSGRIWVQGPPLADADGVGLVVAGDLVDFVAWGDVGSDPMASGRVHDRAVADGLWAAGAQVPTVVAGELGALVTAASAGTGLERVAATLGPDAWTLQANPAPGAATRSKRVELVAATTAADTKTWNLVLVADGDGDLESVWWKELQTLSARLQRLHPDARVLVQFDGASVAEYDAADPRGVTGTLGHAFRGELRGDTHEGRLVLHTPQGGSGRLGEINHGDPATVSGFLSWVRQHYPAQRTAVVMMGHGLGWQGLFSDHSHGRDRLQIGELGEAVDGADIDVMVLYSCLMGQLEVAWELREDVDHLVASQAVLVAGAIPLTQFANELFADPGIAASSLATSVVTHARNVSDTAQLRRHPQTLAALDLGAPLVRFEREVQAFAEAMGAEAPTRTSVPAPGLDDHGDVHSDSGDAMDNVQVHLEAAVRASEHMGRKHGLTTYVDLYDLMARFGVRPVPERYRQPALEVQLSLGSGGGLVLASTHGPLYPRAHGLSVYFPLGQDARLMRPNGRQADHAFHAPFGARFDTRTSARVKYAPDVDPDADCVFGDELDHPLTNAPGFDWASDNSWGQMLHRYYEPVADASCAPSTTIAGIPVTCTGVGSSDVDGGVVDHLWDFDARQSTDTLDTDADCADESDDDADHVGMQAVVPTTAGSQRITLTVTDDTQNVHPLRNETDQDSVVVEVLPLDQFLPVAMDADVVTPWTLAIPNPTDVPLDDVYVLFAAVEDDLAMHEADVYAGAAYTQTLPAQIATRISPAGEGLGVWQLDGLTVPAHGELVVNLQVEALDDVGADGVFYAEITVGHGEFGEVTTVVEDVPNRTYDAF